MGEYRGFRAIRGNSQRMRIREEPGTDSLPLREKILVVAERISGIPSWPEAQTSEFRVFLHPHRRNYRPSCDSRHEREGESLRDIHLEALTFSAIAVLNPTVSVYVVALLTAH